MTATVIRPRVRRWVALEPSTNPFQNCRILSTSAPTVDVTKYKFDAPALVSSIIAWRGIRHVFWAHQGERREQIQFALRGMRLGNALSKIKDKNFDGYCISIADDDRDGKAWWVIPYIEIT